MKIVLFGASGTVGEAVHRTLQQAGASEVIAVSRSSDQTRVDMRDRAALQAFFSARGPFDAVACAAGEVVFAPLADLGPEAWATSFQSKLMGQIQIVEEAIPYMRDGGSFTLISGVVSEDVIRGSVIATTVDRAIEGFAAAAAIELPRGLRINVVSPTLLEESRESYGNFFAGFETTSGAAVGRAYVKSIWGARTGQVFTVG